MAIKKQRIKLGELLVKHDLITPDQLSHAVEKQRKTGQKLGEVLVGAGYISQEKLLNFLAQQFNIPYVDLKSFPLNPEFMRKLPENLARRYRAILLGSTDQGYRVGMVEPQDVFACDEISAFLKAPLEISLIDEHECLNMLNFIYEGKKEIEKLAKELTAEQRLTDVEFDIEELGRQIAVEDAPVAKLLRSLFDEAVRLNASDIHIEPDESVLRIRMRVDGVLHEIQMNELRIAPALAQRLKLLARLNITEKRLPQDGRFTIRVKNRNLDIRLSTMPTEFGESVVMRILDRQAALLHFDQLEIPKPVADFIKKFIQSPHGMLLVTGPTGSGKTTTLYSILNEINAPEEKIITAEDPVEYHLPRINQVQVNPKIGLEFARILRAALRQDPDTIMIGEIRDSETLSIALRAAITGHLVLATMHTNDTASSIVRMLDLQGEPYLIGSALDAVLSQRLVRRICKNCKTPHEPTAEEQAWINSYMEHPPKEATYFTGTGCPHCHQTGYRGRIGVFELLVLTPALRDTIRHNQMESFMALAKKSTKQIWTQGYDLALKGITSLREAMSLTTAVD